MRTKTYYNPITGEVKRSNISLSEPFECVGCRKIAELFTAFKTPEDRKLLYNSIENGIVLFEKLPSKLRHIATRRGLYERPSYAYMYESKGVILLRVINKRHSNPKFKKIKSYGQL